MKVHKLAAKDYAKAIGIGVATAIVLSVIMVTGLKTGGTSWCVPRTVRVFSTNIPS